MNRLTSILLLAAVLGALAGTAHAAVPAGKYRCEYMTDKRLFGEITIVDAKNYKWHSGKGGRYTVSGVKITFTSGPMKGVYKHAEIRKRSGIYMIDLFDGRAVGRTSMDVQCIKRKA